MVEIHGQNSSFSMFVGCFYRAPGSPILKLHELGKSLEEIIQIAKNHTIILGGDFNLPGIDWDLWSVKSGARDPHHCQLLVDTMQDYHLHQLVDKPMRTTRTTSNILDLLFTSKPSLAQTLDIIPGLSDHDIVTTKLLFKAYINKSKPREVFAFKRGNSENFLHDLASECENFLSSIIINMPSVEQMWVAFKEMLMRNAKNHFAVKIIKSFNSNPWFDRSIRRMVRKKQRLYNLAKQKNTAEAWTNFKNFRRLTKHCINHARNNYISSILSDNMTENPNV